MPVSVSASLFVPAPVCVYPSIGAAVEAEAAGAELEAEAEAEDGFGRVAFCRWLYPSIGAR